MGTRVSRQSKDGKRARAAGNGARRKPNAVLDQKKSLGPRRNPPMQPLPQRTRAVIKSQLVVVLATVAGIVFAISTTVILGIGFIADNVSLQAALDTKTIVGLYALSGGFGAVVFLLTTRTSNLPVRWFTLLALVCLCGIIGMQTLPRTWEGLTPDPKKAASNVLAPQGIAMRLDNATLTSAVHASQDLRLARIVDSTLSDVDFSESNLTEADLRQSTFSRVNFAGSDLCGADIRGSDLREAIALDAVSDWSFVLYDATTIFPPTFDVDALYGPILYQDTGMLYSCEDGQTRELLADGNRR